VTTSLERKIPLVTIRSISMSNLQDDWVVSVVVGLWGVAEWKELIVQALNVAACEEGDPVFTCMFKTEMMCVILTLTGGGISVNIGPTCVL
jgi:myosin-1